MLNKFSEPYMKKVLITKEILNFGDSFTSEIYPVVSALYLHFYIFTVFLDFKIIIVKLVFYH
jgi:hypothetical protein